MKRIILLLSLVLIITILFHITHFSGYISYDTEKYCYTIENQIYKLIIQNNTENVCTEREHANPFECDLSENIVILNKKLKNDKNKYKYYHIKKFINTHEKHTQKPIIKPIYDESFLSILGLPISKRRAFVGTHNKFSWGRFALVGT